MCRICIMGGTFDPIHYGHLVVAEEVRHQFKLDKVIFVPAARPPHKSDKIISDPHHRVHMTRIATSSNKYFEVSTLEVERSGPSYTIDTVEAFKKLFGVQTIFFITGADAVLEILTWKEAERLLTLCNFIAATRPGYDLKKLHLILKSLPREVLDNIIPLEVPALSISSTDIRRRVREGRSIKYLLPEAVEEYLRVNCLYTKESC